MTIVSILDKKSIVLANHKTTQRDNYVTGYGPLEFNVNRECSISSLTVLLESLIDPYDSLLPV